MLCEDGVAGLLVMACIGAPASERWVLFTRKEWSYHEVIQISAAQKKAQRCVAIKKHAWADFSGRWRCNVTFGLHRFHVLAFYHQIYWRHILMLHPVCSVHRPTNRLTSGCFCRRLTVTTVTGVSGCCPLSHDYKVIVGVWFKGPDIT